MKRIIVVILCVATFLMCEQPVERSQINLPESAPIAPVGSSPFGLGQPALAISPDGSNIVYVADIEGQTQLHIRPLDQSETTPIKGTEGAYHPFFSPDGQWIGFFVRDELKKISIAGDLPVVLCKVTNPFGADWGSDNLIYFTQHEGATFSKISADGGKVNNMAQKSGTNMPKFLSNDIVLASMWPGGIKAIFTETLEEKLIVEGPCSNPLYLSPGYLLYEREGKLLAVKFDLKKVEVVGEPVKVLDNIRISTWGAVQCAISLNGTLVYLSGTKQNIGRLVWLDRHGNEEVLQFPAAEYGTFQVSPDGQRLAISIRESEQSNIWVYDLVEKSRTQLTFEGNNNVPIWTPGSDWVTFNSDRNGYPNLFMKKIDNTGELVQLTANKEEYEWMAPSSWSPDNKVLALSANTPGGKSGILMLDRDKIGELVSFTKTEFTEWGPVFSHDSRHIAYTSDESGQYEIYVEPFPKTGERWRVSDDSGEEPVWSKDNNELYYRNVLSGKRWMAVSYTGTEKLSFKSPQTMFEGYYINVAFRSYDVSSDGHFLLLKRAQETENNTQLSIVTNWFEEIKNKVR